VSGRARRLHAVVVGGGIGGLTAALSLHEVGVEVDLYESAEELRPLGVGINLLPHAVREIDALGLLPALLARGVEPTETIYFTKRGQEIWREPRGRHAGYPWPQVSIHRGTLQTILLDAVHDRVGAEHVHLNQRLVGVDDRPHTATARFADHSVEADLVVAADGIHSAVRHQRFPHEGPPCWNGALLWRGVAIVEPVLGGRAQIWAGHPAQKFVAYPIKDLAGGQQELNFIAEISRPHQPPRHREDWNQPGDLADFLPAFREWTFHWLKVPDVIRAAPGTYLFPMVDRDPLPQWTFGRTTLLGDAAHPMFPIGSNGASQAILDARTLAGCIRRYADPDAALARYEAVRRPATAGIVEANRRMGPELPMKLVEERAPDGFRAIADVITPEEIVTITEDYRRTAGFALAALQDSQSLADNPEP
jgi:2-polyprenyl-6-methoxyphenol hydroxylase-like FAD-dependent oxidoreductase